METVINIENLEKLEKLNVNAESVKTELDGSLSLFVLPTQKGGTVEDMVYITMETDTGSIVEVLSIESAATFGLLLSNILLEFANNQIDKQIKLIENGK